MIDCQQQEQDQALSLFREKVAQREGHRNIVYRDSRGRLTVGIGHLVTPADDLELGEEIDDARVDALFAADAHAAMEAARAQMAEAGILDTAFEAALAGVCFQLGCGWTREFPDTWRAICRGEYARAADMLNGTRWARETPTRVWDFQWALSALANRSPSTASQATA